MKIIKQWCPALLALILCGCFQVEDELNLQADGSGTIRLKVHSMIPEEAAAMAGMGIGGGVVMYPPADEAEARRFFPRKDFTLKVEEKAEKEGKTVLIEAAFKDVNALLASPYGRAHQLVLQTNQSGALKVQALSGGEAVGRFANFEPEGEMAAIPMPGMQDLQKNKEKMRFEFRITLPAAITEANGAKNGQTVTWAVERAQCKDDDEFTSKLGNLLEASCASSGLKFSPVAQPRLALLAFNQLGAGSVGTAAKLPDTNKITATARFVPYSLHVTRTLDLSGEGSSRESQAQLIGAVVIPADLAPQRWGEVKLQEAVDGKGNSLLPKEGEESSGRIMQMQFNSMADGFDTNDESEDDDTADKPATKTPADKPHILTLSFNAPEWKVKEVGKIKATVEMKYLGNSEVIKVTNAIAAGQIMDMSKGFTSYRPNSEQGQISHPRLAELGLPLRVDSAMAQSGMTTLSLRIEGAKSTLVDAQVFDADGHPWPTILMQYNAEAEGGSCQLMIAGKPKPPLSLGLVVSGLGASVELPISLEKIPVSGK